MYMRQGLAAVLTGLVNKVGLKIKNIYQSLPPKC